MSDDAYREAEEIEPEIDPEWRARLVLEAVEASFRNTQLSCLSHYQDHVKYRWMFNLRRALEGCEEFDWSSQSWGERYDLLNLGWWKFFWRTRKMPWAAKFRWISERLERRQAKKLPRRT